MNFKSFNYSGVIESSKSIVNRALILQAIHPQLKVNYISEAQDVVLLKKALQQFKDDKESYNNKDSILFDVGSGGTTFRFLSLFLSKYLGTWRLKLSDQLISRPYDDLIYLLEQLGVQVLDQNLKKNNIFKIKSSFWTSKEVTVDFEKSSQFFSAVALAASDCKTDFIIHCQNREKSSGYEEITLDLIKKLGVNVHDKGSQVILHNPGVASYEKTINVGADWSSVIYLLSFCFSGANIAITNMDVLSKEPDKKGLELLQQFGLEIKEHKALSSKLMFKDEHIDLRHNPDLFPVMVVLASQWLLNQQKASSLRILYPQQLVYKESDRLTSMIDVMIQLGFCVKDQKSQGLHISFQSQVEEQKHKEHYFDSKKDHRLIMSYELLKSFGYKVHYDHKEEVKKSFSNFFEIIYG